MGRFGPSCLLKLGRLGPSCLGLTFLWAELSWADLSLGRVVCNSHFDHLCACKANDAFRIITVNSFCSTEAYVEVLDGSRVHPETYEWARKMAVDALEYDDTAEDANPAGALEEILESPERLKDLDLDAFAEELERQVRN